MGASTPHFALQLRNRIAKLVRGLPEDHPARHGLVGPAFSRMIGLWWGQLMTSLREHIETRR